MNIFKEPREPSYLFNYTDISMLILFNICVFILNKLNFIRKTVLIKMIIGFLFVLIFPFISIGIEVDHSVRKFGKDDSFTLLYTFFRFPVWWFIGIINIALFSRFLNNDKE